MVSVGHVSTGALALVIVFAFGPLLQPVHPQSPLQVLEVKLDRPTVRALGVQVLIAGDEDRSTSIDVRVRRQGTTRWLPGMPLLRVWPESVFIDVPAQFSGSVFDLQPGTTYEIELSASPQREGTWRDTLVAATRALPRDPHRPRVLAVADAAQFRAALGTAGPGDIIELAAGVYSGTFVLPAGGRQDRPIVIRGAPDGATVLDGGDCTACDIVEVTGSYVHVEKLTLRSAMRALRFSTEGATANVARHLRIRDVVHGIGKAAGQTDFYIADNDIEGRLQWPWALQPGARSHWDDRGIDVAGDGHVIAHNRIAGFGDPVVNKKAGSRSWDVYGNDILDAFDGVELDEAAGNARLWRNRFTNVMAPVSIQPIHGGPAYVLRNVVYNVPDEHIKLKSLGNVQLPSGALIYHNTFVGSKRALNLQSPITQYNFELRNNLFIGPPEPQDGRVVDWTTTVVGSRFDFNGYWPDGGFWFGTVDGKWRQWQGFAAVQAAGDVEQNGRLLRRDAIFAGGFVGPDDAQTRYEPPSFVLHPRSGAINAGELIGGVNAGHGGSAPDLGAIEAGCEEPHYGPRAPGQQDRVWPVDCAVAVVTDTGY